MWIACTHSIDLFKLTGREIFVRIETPTPGKQPLPAQNLVYPRDATGKPVARVEKGGVRVRQFRRKR